MAEVMAKKIALLSRGEVMALLERRQWALSALARHRTAIDAISANVAPVTVSTELVVAMACYISGDFGVFLDGVIVDDK